MCEQDVQVLEKLAVVVEQQARMTSDIESQGGRIEMLVDLFAGLDKRLAVFVAQQTERQRSTEQNVERNYGFIRENWANIAQIGGTLAVLSKVSGIW